MTTVAATGVLRASWLLLAFPVFGAAVLLIGGRFTDKWGHLLGVLMSLASFVYGVIAFFTLLGYNGNRSRDLQLGRDPQCTVVEDLAAEQRIEEERQLEAGTRGREDQ